MIKKLTYKIIEVQIMIDSMVQAQKPKHQKKKHKKFEKLLDL